MGRPWEEKLCQAHFWRGQDLLRESSGSRLRSPYLQPLTLLPHTQTWTRLGLGAADCSTLPVPATLRGQWAWQGQGECDQIVIRSAIVFPGAWGQGTCYRAVGRLLPGASKNRKVRRGDLQPGPWKPSRPPEPSAVSFLLPPWSLGPRSVQGEVGCLSGLEGWDISGCPEKPLSTLGEGEVPPLTCPSCGLHHLDKASSSLSTSHHVPGPL